MAPERIVSLVPSLTELVFWLGAGERLVGRTRFCTEPAGQVENVRIVGGTKNPNLDRIAALKPDLVLANKEENRREDIEALVAAGVNALLTDPNSVDEAVSMIRDLGDALDARQRADSLTLDVESALAETVEIDPVRVYVGVWHNPMMGLGSESYGHSLIERCGGRNVLGSRPRYPEVTLAELRTLRPELILLPDEPFPFDEGHRELYSAVAPAKAIDGKLVWWYGPRMPAAIRALNAIFLEHRNR